MWKRIEAVKLIVGLGNPGSKYADTRHNVGFRVIDALAARWSIDTSQEKFHAWFGKGVVGSEACVLLKPTTFMNRSGQAVQAVGRFYQLDFADVLVVADDLALDPGRLRMRPSGSAGSHRGLQDIIDRIGSESFARLRMGIGGAVGDAASYVLSRFSAAEAGLIDEVVGRAANAVECWITDGVEETMNRYNGLVSD
ncbi:MAG: aminoacyl-tRNA hydrolase [bacterium]|nr:aminoacyl-tRNA hydrolase [bacterium]